MGAEHGTTSMRCEHKRRRALPEVSCRAAAALVAAAGPRRVRDALEAGLRRE